MSRTEELTQKYNATKKIGFDEWMNSPIVRAMLSMMPPSEHLEIVLKTCYEQGYNNGIATIMIDLITMSRKPVGEK